MSKSEHALMEQFYKKTGKAALLHWFQYVAWKKQQRKKKR